MFSYYPCVLYSDFLNISLQSTLKTFGWLRVIFGIAAHNLQFALQNCYYAYCYVWDKVFQRLVKAWKDVVTETHKEHILNL